MTHGRRTGSLALMLLGALAVDAQAQGRDLGACAAVSLALNPADPMHPSAANIAPAQTALAQCGAPGSATYQLSLALIESVRGAHEAVLAAVAPVLAAVPDNRYALRFRCHALANTRRAAEALPLCDRALAANAEWAPGHHSRGWALSQLGRRTDAIAALQRATQLQPQYAYSWNNLAAFTAESGLYASALGSYQRARALLPGDSLVWRNIGRTLLQLRDYNGAASTFDSVVAAHPGYALAWFERGDLEQRRDRPTAARAFVERALAIDPRLADALVLRGELRLIDKDVDGSLADYRAAAVANPTWAVPHYRIARTLRQTKRCAEARTALVEALVLAPEWETLAEEIRNCPDDLRGMLAMLNAATARAPSKMVSTLRATLPDSVHPPAAQADDWARALEGVTDSTTPRALQALRGRGRALFAARRFPEAIAAFTTADRLLRRSTVTGYPVSSYRLEVTAALAVLHAEHGDPAQALRFVTELEDSTAAFRARADAKSLQETGVPAARPLTESSLAYNIRVLEVKDAGPIEVGLRLLNKGDVRGTDWLIRTKPTEAALGEFRTLVRSGRVTPAAFRARVLDVAGRPGTGRMLESGVDKYQATVTSSGSALPGPDEEIARVPVPYYPDARQSLAADRRQAAAFYLYAAWDASGRGDRELRLAAFEHGRDLPLSAESADGPSLKEVIAQELLLEDLGFAFMAPLTVDLCRASSATPAFRLQLTRSEQLGLTYVRFELRRNDGLWQGARQLQYEPRRRQLQVEIGFMETTVLADVFTLDGVLATGGALRGSKEVLRRCR